ncbi:unnamed protein product [Camellia sinensis]
MQKKNWQMGTKNTTFLSLPLLLFFLTIPSSESATDTLTQPQPISVGQTLISAGEIFELGFFCPQNSSSRYIGIWYKNLPGSKVVWVANRNNPLRATDTASSLTIGIDGNLRLVDGQRNTVWSTNVSVQSNNTIAVLSDKGEFVIRDYVSGWISWESFKYPSDTFLSGMMIGMNYKTGEKQFLTSWKADDDPSPGKYMLGLTPETPAQAFLWNGSEPLWRSGPWDGSKFIGIPNPVQGYVNGLNLIQDNQQGNVYLSLNVYNTSYITIVFITPTGILKSLVWDQVKRDWYVSWKALENPCTVYGVCGDYSICDKNGSPICSCLRGFVPSSDEDWRRGNWSGGCVRKTELECRKNLTEGGGKNDGYWKVSGLKLPDRFQYLYSDDFSSCQQWCSKNCSCEAYAFVTTIGCMVWAGRLTDVQQFTAVDGYDLFLRLPYSELGADRKKNRKNIIISSSIISGVLVLGGFIFGFIRWRRANRRGRKRTKSFHFGNKMDSSRDTSEDNIWVNNSTHPDSSELPMIDFDKILVATNNFCRTNKLGEGGFGPVYRGKLEDGQVVAVKRLSSHSGQGAEEFKNEILLISKLQHRNLVRLLGCCIEGEENLLVYEYMTNKSLDMFLFDSKKRVQLDWPKRFYIIQGIARGLLYLHRDSCLRVIHRDLKASNILLDNDMNPKISDFGLARTFHVTQELANTRRVMGTFGYMSPEYAMRGLFSEKSDVFSFGVLLLEIVCGTRNTSLHYHENYLNLLGYAWQLWSENRAIELMDETLADSCSPSEVVKCIHIGLLCVQDHVTVRPTMSAILLMLSSEMELPQPKLPAFTIQGLSDSELQSQSNNICSTNNDSISIIEGR